MTGQPDYEAQGRVYTVGGEDWDEIVAAAEDRERGARSTWSSTWARSTRPPTGCSG